MSTEQRRSLQLGFIFLTHATFLKFFKGPKIKDFLHTYEHRLTEEDLHFAIFLDRNWIRCHINVVLAPYIRSPDSQNVYPETHSF